MDTPLRFAQPTRSKELKESRRKDTNVTMSHTINWQNHHDDLLGIIKVFFSSIFYHMVLKSMVHTTRCSFTGYPLLFRRNVAGKLRRDVLLLHDNVPVHKSNIIQVAAQYTDFTELNHPAYSPDLAANDYYLFSNLKDILHGSNFETDDEAIRTVNHYLDSLDSDFFFLET